MSQNIRGITVEIAGNTTGLSNALQDVNQRSRNLSGELSQVQRLLRLDPSNVNLVAQQQQLLADAVENSREKLNRLRAAQQQVDEQFRNGTISQESYRAFQREVAKAEQELNRFENRLESTAKKTDTLGDKLKKASDKARGFGATATAGSAGAAVGAVALVETYADQELNQAILEQNAQNAKVDRELVEKLQNDLAGVGQDREATTEAISNLVATQGINNENLEQITEGLSGAALKYKETLNIEGLGSDLQESISAGEVTGMFGELLSREGINIDEFNVKLAEAKENGTAAQLVMDTLANQGLNDVKRAFEENNPEIVAYNRSMDKFKTAMGDLSSALAPVITQIAQSIADVVNRFANMDEATQKLILTVAGIAAIVGPLAIAMGAILTPIGGITLAIVGLVAAGTYLYTHWDEVKAKAVEVWESIKAAISEKVEALKLAISQTWENIKQKTTEAWDSIKSFLIEWWPLLLGALAGPIGLVAVLIYQNWDAIKTKTIEIWTNITNWLSNLWQKILADVTITWANIGNFINTIIDTIEEIFTGLVDSAFNWGRNLISNLIDGIRESYDALRDVISGAAGMVGDYLGFSSPTKKGPGREADKWAPNFVEMYAEGISKSMPQLQNALMGTASTLQLSAVPNGATNNYGGNTIIFQVTEGWEQIERELYKRGVVL